MELIEIATNNVLLEIARRAIEDQLIKNRDEHIFIMRANGVGCRNRDGSESPKYRLNLEDALQIGLLAINNYISENETIPDTIAKPMNIMFIGEGE